MAERLRIDREAWSVQREKGSERQDETNKLFVFPFAVPDEQ